MKYDSFSWNSQLPHQSSTEPPAISKGASLSKEEACLPAGLLIFHKEMNSKIYLSSSSNVLRPEFSPTFDFNTSAFLNCSRFLVKKFPPFFSHPRLNSLLSKVLWLRRPRCKLTHCSVTVVASRGHMCSSYLGPWESTGPEGHGHWESPPSGKGREQERRVLSRLEPASLAVRGWQTSALAPHHSSCFATTLLTFSSSSFLLNDTLTWKWEF